jgi:hypothetical protein
MARRFVTDFTAFNIHKNIWRKTDMKAENFNNQKTKQALVIKSIIESVVVISGGIALIVLEYYWWGILCVVIGLLGILLKTVEPKRRDKDGLFQI